MKNKQKKIVSSVEYDWREVPDNATLTLTGWGFQSIDGGAPNILQKIELKKVNFEFCAEKFVDTVLEGRIDYSHLCTFNKLGEGACYGDSYKKLSHFQV